MTYQNFIEQMERASGTLSIEELDKMIKKSASVRRDLGIYASESIMEEFVELIREMLVENRMTVLEELADCYLGLGYLCEMENTSLHDVFSHLKTIQLPKIKKSPTVLEIELCELYKKISKHIRSDVKNGSLFEIIVQGMGLFADIMAYYKIFPNELNKALNVKKKREEDRTNQMLDASEKP